MTTQDVQNTTTKLIEDWNGKYLKVLTPGNQCFDVSAKFCDMLGVPHYPNNPTPFPYPNASQIYTDFGAFQAQYFDRIPNTPTAVPQRGDIVIWDKALNGGIGHVAVATGKGSTSSFESFDQNWVVGNPCKVIQHSYNYVLGWLRLKVSGTSTTPQPMDNRAYFFDLIKNSDIPFDWGTNDSKQVKESKVKEFITWVKSQITRAGQWDLICKDANYLGDTNMVKHDYIAGKLKGMGGCSPDELMKAKQDAQKQIVAAVQNVVLK